MGEGGRGRNNSCLTRHLNMKSSGSSGTALLLLCCLSNGAKNSPRMVAAAAPAAADAAAAAATAADDDDYGLMRHIRHTIDAYGSRTPLQSSPLLLLQTLSNYCVVAGK